MIQIEIVILESRSSSLEFHIPQISLSLVTRANVSLLLRLLSLSLFPSFRRKICLASNKFPRTCIQSSQLSSFSLASPSTKLAYLPSPLPPLLFLFHSLQRRYLAGVSLPLSSFQPTFSPRLDIYSPAKRSASVGIVVTRRETSYRIRM